MKSLIKMIIWIIAISALVYILLLGLVYRYQEKLIFMPDVLPANYTFQFDGHFKEKFIETPNNTKLNGLLFTTDSPKGVIFFLHGNAGALNSWGFISDIYTAQKYDIFMLDFRGFGKSGGTISSEAQFYNDAQIAYDSIKKEFGEDKITIIGQSIGTAPAAMLAAKNNPKKLILISPYYSLEDLMYQKYHIIPGFLLKYKFRTNEFISKVKAPIFLIHGADDKLINSKATVRLKQLCKKDDTMIIIPNIGHNGINDNNQFQKEIKEILK